MKSIKYTFNQFRATNNYMKKFLQYFVLEFVIIFVIGSIGYWILGVSFDINQILFVSLVSGVIIAYAMLALQKRNQ